jgi:hypothetical protein
MFFRGHPKLKSVFSALILIAFIPSNLNIPMAEAGISHFNPDRLEIIPDSSIVHEIKISPKLGDIITRYDGSSKNVVIQIQDAHCNFEAQSNTARILEKLFKKYREDLKIVNVEGSSGELDTSALTLFPNAEIKKQMALYYLKKGKISGAEYLSIIKDEAIKIRGVEDLKLYFQNLKWFDKSLEYREKADQLLDGLEKTFGQLQAKVFNEDLKRFLESHENYEKGSLSLIDFIKRMDEVSQRKEVKVKDLKNVSLFLKSEEASREIDFEKVEKERTESIDALLPLLSKEESTEFLTQNLYFRLEKTSAYEYFKSLGKLMKNKKLSKGSYGNLIRYIAYLKDFNGIDRGKFGEEIEVWAQRIEEKLYRAEEERELRQRIKEVHFLKNFYHLELSREDLKFYQERKKEIRGQSINDFLEKTCEKHNVQVPDFREMGFLEENLLSLERFYEIAIQRDEVLAHKTIEGFKKTKEKIAVLIAGGFHTEGIREKLRKMEISYVVISPRITNLEERSPYISVMEDERSLIDEVFKKELMNREVVRRASRGKKTNRSVAEAVNPMSPFQRRGDLVALLSQQGVNKGIVKRKLESANLFALVSPSLLKILASVKDDGAWKGVFQVWQSRVNSRVGDEAKKRGIARADHAVIVQNVEPIKGRTFIRLKINDEIFGVIVDQKAQSSDKEAFELNFMSKNDFEKTRLNTLGSDALKGQNAWRIYFETSQDLVRKLSSPPPKLSSPTRKSPPERLTMEELESPDSTSAFKAPKQTSKNGQNYSYLSDQDKEKLKNLLENSYTKPEIEYLPDEKSLIKILKHEGVTEEVWKKCLERERFLSFEKNYNNDKFASWLLALILIPMGVIVHFHHGFADSLISVARTPVLESAIKLLQFRTGSFAEAAVGIMGLGGFAGFFWVSIKTLIVHALIFGLGGIINRFRTKNYVRRFEDLMEMKLEDYVEEYRRRKKNVISSKKDTMFERPLQEFFKGILIKLINDLPKYDQKKGRQNFQTTRYFMSFLLVDVDIQNTPIDELLEMAKQRIHANPQRRFHRMLMRGVTLGLIEEVTRVSENREIVEIDRDIYYAYLDRLQSLNPGIYENYLKVRRDFKPIEIFSKIRVIFSNGLDVMNKQDLMTMAILFKVFNGTERGLAERFLVKHFKKFTPDEIGNLIQKSASKLNQAGIVVDAVSMSDRFRDLLMYADGFQASQTTPEEMDIVFLNWAEKIVSLEEKYPHLSEVLGVALDDIPDASWVGDDIFEIVAQSDGFVDNLRQLLQQKLELHLQQKQQPQQDDQQQRLKLVTPGRQVHLGDHSAQSVRNPRKRSVESRPPPPASLEENASERLKEVKKPRRLLPWVFGAMLGIIGIGNVAYMIGHRAGSDADRTSSTSTQMAPGSSVNTATGSVAPVVPNVFDVVRFDRSNPITDLNRFSWSALPSEYDLRIETSTSNTFPAGSTTVYNPSHSETSMSLTNSVGHTFMRLTLLRADASRSIVGNASDPISITVPTIPAVSGFSQVDGANTLRWNAISGVNGYRIYVRDAETSPWRLLRSINNATTSETTFSGSVNGARIVAFVRNGSGPMIDGAESIIEVSPVAPPRPTHSPRPRPRPSGPNPLDLLRAPFRTGKVEGRQKEIDFGKVSGSTFRFMDRLKNKPSLSDEQRHEYQGKIREALAFLNRYQDLSGVELPVMLVEDLDTLMDFGHEKNLLRIDTDAFSDENYSPQVMSLLLNHEIAHARGADEFEAVKGDLEYYRKIIESGQKMPETLVQENPYFAFLEKNYTQNNQVQDSAIRSYLWRLELSRGFWRFANGVQGFFKRIGNKLTPTVHLFNQAGSWLLRKMNPLNLFIGLGRQLRALVVAFMISLSSSLVFLFTPSLAMAQETDMSSRVRDGYKLTVATDRIPEGQVLVIQTCGAANCSATGGRESYAVHRGDEGHVWLTRSRGHTRVRMGFHEVRGTDEWGREDLRLIDSWTGPFSISLTIPASAPAPGHLSFNGGTRRLTWDRVEDVRGYLLEAFDSSISDDSRTLNDERWVSLGEIAQGDNPGLEITRPNLSRVRVMAVRGGRGGEIRGAATEIALDTYTVPATGLVNPSGTAAARTEIPDLGFVLRMPYSYTLNLTPQDGVSEYKIYTSDSREALEALRQFFITGDESHRTRARGLGYQEYTARDPGNIQLRNSYGHDYILIRPRTGSGDSARDGTPSAVTLIGSSFVRDTDSYFRLAYHGVFSDWNTDRLQWELGLREATFGMFIPPPIEPFGRPMRLEAGYRRLPFVADDHMQMFNFSFLTLGTRWHWLYSSEPHQVSFSMDPTMGITLTPLNTFGGIFRLPYDFRYTVRASPNDSFEFGLGGEFRAVPMDGIDFIFDTRSGDPVPGTTVPIKRWARDSDLLYSRILWSPSIMYRHRFSPDARLSFGARYDDEVTVPWAHTLWGVAELELPTGFRLAAQGGHTWDEHLTDPDKNPVGRSWLLRGNLSWRPVNVFSFGVTEAYRFVDGENVTGGNLTFYLPGSYAITADVQYLARKSGFEEGIVSFIGFQGALDLPIPRERAPLNTGKEGEASELDGGVLKSGRFVFDLDRPDMLSLNDDLWEDYERKLNEALKFLSRYVELGGLNLPISIVEDLDTWMDFSHEVDNGAWSRFGIERGLLRIDTDAIREGKYIKEAVALLLNHEIAHARGADEIGAILSDLAFYKRLKEDQPGFDFPSELKNEHRYFEFLAEHYDLDPEDQVDGIRIFLIENEFAKSERLTIRMSQTEAIEYGRRIQGVGELKSALEKIEGLYEEINRETLLRLIVKSVEKMLGDDVIEDHAALRQKLAEIIGGMAKSTMSFDEMMKSVEKILELKTQSLEDFDDIRSPDWGNEMQGVAVALLLVAGFLRGGRVSPGIFEKITRAYLDGESHYDSHSLSLLTLDDMFEIYAKENQMDDENVSLEGFDEIIDFFRSIERLTSGEVREASKMMKKLNRQADIEEELKDLIRQTQAKLIKIYNDGTLEVAGKFVELPSLSRVQFKKFYERVNREESDRTDPLYLDLIGKGYVHPSRFNKILEALLEHPEQLERGIEIGNFLAQSKKVDWGYEDGALVKARLVDHVIQIEIQDLAQRYEELSKRIQRRILSKMKGWERPRVLVATGKAFGLEFQRDDKGKVLVQAQTEDFRKFYGQVLEMLRHGENMLKIAIPILLPEGIEKESVSKDLILSTLFPEEQYARLKERLKEEIYIEFYSQDHPAVQDQTLGRKVFQDVIFHFNQKGVALDSERPMMFIVSEEEKGSYQDIQDILWTIQGNLDAKKLLLIAEYLSSQRIEDQELLDFLKKADPETIEEMNRRQLTSPKVMMEDLDLRIKSGKQTDTMA